MAKLDERLLRLSEKMAELSQKAAAAEYDAQHAGKN